MTMQDQINQLRVQRIDSLAQLEAMSGPLADLVQASGALVYQHPAFFLPWSRVAIANGQHPACLALFDGSRLVGFLPLFVKRDRRAMLGRVLMTPRYGSSPPFDLMLAGVDETTALDLLMQEVQSSAWIEQQFRFDIAGSRFGSVWADRFAAAGHKVTRTPGPDYLLYSCAGGADGLRQGLPRKHRMNCERLERRLLEFGRVDLVTGGAALEPALAAMASIVEKSWKGSPEMGRRGLAMLMDVSRSLAAEGMLRLWLVHGDDAPIAYLLEIEDKRNCRHAFHNAQNEEAAHYSPGIVLLYTALKAAHRDGVDTYEYWGFRNYIVKFSNGSRQTRSVSIANPGVLLTARNRIAQLLGKGKA